MLQRTLLIIILLVCPSVLWAQASQPGKPNIIFILADDLGWGDLSVDGHER